MIDTSLNVLKVPRYQCVIYESSVEGARDVHLQTLQTCEQVCDTGYRTLPATVTRVWPHELDVDHSHSGKRRHYFVYVEIETYINVDGHILTYQFSSGRNLHWFVLSRAMSGTPAMLKLFPC